MSHYTHTIGPKSLDRVLDRDLTNAEATDLARSIGTALARLQPGIGQWASAYFIGQCAHESGEFRFPRELWGPTKVQAGYWRRRELQGPGLLYPGLGKKARGAGWIQTTGRANLRRAAVRLGRPEKQWARVADAAAQPLMASLLAAIWWADHFPKDMSGDSWDTLRVSRIVNLGNDRTALIPNGFQERVKYTRRAVAVREFLNPEPL